MISLVTNPFPLEQEENRPAQFQQGQVFSHTIERLREVMGITGIIAFISAVAAIIFTVRAEEPENEKVGKWAGTCYVVAEMILITAVVSFIALKIFMKLRHS